jgi:hypothetical protein
MKTSVQNSMQRNPGSSFLATLCSGFAFGLLVGMAWADSRQKARARQGFLDFTRTPLRRAGSFASDGMGSLNRGLRDGEAQLEQLIRNLRSRFASYLS